MKKITKKIKKGFTLIEMMISIFMFLLLMIAIVQIFAQQIRAYRHARSVQNDMENAQFAMNYVAKTLRTGTIIASENEGDLRELMRLHHPNDDFALQLVGSQSGAEESLTLYDFSQEACIRFVFRKDHNGYTPGALWVLTSNPDQVQFNEIEECMNSSSYTGSRERRLTTGDVYGGFAVAPTRYTNDGGEHKTEVIGRATITMKVLPDPDKLRRGTNPIPVNMQTTVSLRDYPPDLSF